MRIIAGELRGRSIAAPPGRGTRPMLDRVREALFGTLMPWLAEARVLDLFAGSGSLGLEALSRGAASARFVEQAPAAGRLLRQNVRDLGLEEHCELVPGDALARFHWGADEDGYDIVFCDPPYPMLEDGAARRRVLVALETLVSVALRPEGVVVFHAPRGVLRERDFQDPGDFGGSGGIQCSLRTYGSNALWFLQPAEAPSEEGG